MATMGAVELEELERGVVVLAVLSRLRVPHHGPALRAALARDGVPVECGALYPLLRRLEARGLVAGAWDAGQSPRRVYRLSAAGRQAFARSAARLCVSWAAQGDTDAATANARW